MWPACPWCYQKMKYTKVYLQIICHGIQKREQLLPNCQPPKSFLRRCCGETVPGGQQFLVRTPNTLKPTGEVLFVPFLQLKLWPCSIPSFPFRLEGGCSLFSCSPPQSLKELIVKHAQFPKADFRISVRWFNNKTWIYSEYIINSTQHDTVL